MTQRVVILLAVTSRSPFSRLQFAPQRHRRMQLVALSFRAKRKRLPENLRLNVARRPPQKPRRQTQQTEH
jgi:hypothetical protein